MKPTPLQQKAIDETGKNIIVSAGAGSGKTAVLTKRVMRILKEGTSINELLILTFTKAAAAEMKERIRNDLKKESLTNPSLKKELELIDQAYITTFDSFALSIVKKYHYLLNISNNVSISEDSIIMLKKHQLIDETFDEYYASNNPLFQKLIYNFCVKDDQDIKDYLLKIADKIDAMPNRDEYLNNYLDNYTSSIFFNKCLDEYTSIIKNEINNIKKQAQKLSILTDGTYATKLELSLQVLYNASTIDEIIATINNLDIPRLPNKSEDEVKEARQNFKNYLDNIIKIVNKYGSKEEITNTFNNTKDYLNIIISIINTFLKKLHDYKEENELYTFQDIALLSIKILEENASVREELKYFFKEIMIDEYQDTNDIQETFVSMIENNNVYMVGDIKQSIYRFRNANPYIFKSKYDAYSKNDNGLKIDLLQNFRSRSEVLNNINEIFDLIMDNSLGGAEYKESHRMEFGNLSYDNEGKTEQDYNMSILEYNSKDTNYKNDEIEIFTIARDIQNKINNHYQVFDKNTKELRDITYQDFVILMDRGKSFDLYKKVFEYLGIPLSVFQDKRLTNSEDIYIIKNIIDLLIHMQEENYDINFRYSITSIARSYLYNIPDQEIFSYFKNNNFKDSTIYKDFYELSTKLKSQSITNILEEIFKITNIYSKIITIGNIDSTVKRLSYLIDIADNLSTLGYNIYTFRDYLCDLLDSNYEIKYKDNNSNVNAVKIMTIHTSKGLEYHICYYSGLFNDFNIRELNERFLFSNNYGIIVPSYEDGIKETFLKYLTKYHYLEEEISEKIRLFYVALTRAKEKMIILIPEVSEEIHSLEPNRVIDNTIRYKYHSLKDILVSIKHYLLKYYKTINIDELNISKNYLYSSNKPLKLEDSITDINVNEIPLLKEEELTTAHFSKTLHELINNDIKSNINLGLQFHETLEYLDFNNPDYSLIDNSFIKNKVQEFLKLDILSNLKDAEIYKEYEFIYTEDNIEYHGIIDLLLEYPDKIDIIDYKLSNIEDPNYLKQLKGYQTYINKITGKEVNIYLYSILTKKVKKL